MDNWILGRRSFYAIGEYIMLDRFAEYCFENET